MKSKKDALKCPKKACDTCPYLKATPSGIWSEEEYRKLPKYDDNESLTLSIFHCHQENATGVPTVCRGWVSTARESISVRLGVLQGLIAVEDLPNGLEDAYYSSGHEACEAGLRDIDDPSEEALELLNKLLRRGAGR